MKRKIIFYFVFGLFILMLVVLSACNNFSTPPTMWDPNRSYATGSVITGVLPANSALAGVREISIIGKFSSKLDSNWIYFGSEQAIIKRMSAAADTLVVYRPVISGALTINAVILQADSVGKFSYNLESPISSSDLTGIPTGIVGVMEANKNGTAGGDTLWIASTGYITMLKPNGIDLIPYKDTSYFKTKINNKATDFVKAFSDMKFGPHGFLYATFAGSKSIYQLDTASATPIAYVTFSAAYSSSVFDFNSNGDIYFNGSKSGLILIKQGSTTPVVVGSADYAGTTFVGIRIYNGYVYAADATSLFRSPINPDGTVGSKQPVVNIAADTSLRGCTVSSFNFASDGTVLVSLLGNANYSLYILENGSLLPYYYNNILPTGISQLIWGGGRYLYLRSSTATSLYKIGMAKEDNTPLLGAPYLGRNLP
ncbi:MAG: hypothetical protein ABSA44_12825 [Bacteroidota bacterium]|jgi:hypothetical protein